MCIRDRYEGEIYKYEIKTRAGEPMLKADPYANYAELRPNNASIVSVSYTHLDVYKRQALSANPS